MFLTTEDFLYKYAIITTSSNIEVPYEKIYKKSISKKYYQLTKDNFQN